jgi:hypothetical protein
MLVRVQDGVNHADALPQKLLPQIRRRVDKKISGREPEGESAARAIVARIRAGANWTVAADGWNSDARAGAEKHEAPGDVATCG